MYRTGNARGRNIRRGKAVVLCAGVGGFTAEGVAGLESGTRGHTSPRFEGGGGGSEAEGPVLVTAHVALSSGEQVRRGWVHGVCP